MRTFAILTTLLLSSLSHGDPVSGQQGKAGFKAGFSVSNLKRNDEGRRAYAGLHLGGFFAIGDRKPFEVEPEVVYAQHGFGTVSSEVRARFDYLTFPLVLKYYLNDELNVQFGPQLGMLLSARFGPPDDDIDVSDFIEDFDWGLVIGFGSDSESGVLTSIRFYLGLRDVDKTSEAEFFNRVVQLSVGYGF